MTEENKVWVITWSHYDGSGYGIVNNIAYKDYQAAQHIVDTLRTESAPKQYVLVEMGVVQGELR
jgi:hypothetical protein